jgi:hypothetical protein
LDEIIDNTTRSAVFNTLPPFRLTMLRDRPLRFLWLLRIPYLDQSEAMSAAVKNSRWSASDTKQSCREKLSGVLGYAGPIVYHSKSRSAAEN